MMSPTTPTAAAAQPPHAATAAFQVRALAASDFEAVVAIDATVQGRTRRSYIERRLAAALREPSLHAQFAATGADGVAGFMLARVLAGEFGRTRRTLRLEMMGVRPECRGAGAGHQLFEALAAWARRHGVAEVRSTAQWRDHDILAFFDALGFELAAEQVVQGSVEGGAYHAGRDAAPPAAEEDDGNEPPREIDYARLEAEGGNDHDRHSRHARDAADVRTMTAADLDAIVRIDRRLTGHDRRAYIAARLDEALAESGVRVSLVACSDGQPVGYLMARADLGDYGRTEPVAVIDTLGVDPGFEHRGLGRALMSQLFANLGALRVERVETVAPFHDLPLLGFLAATGFEPGQRLSFVRRI
ncbi:MAG: GNAT family N-acetyltransferase [Rubrivivax sp.]|nr:GNAT family N-acetyltransferase [Rubrivivax sp.]